MLAPLGFRRVVAKSDRSALDVIYQAGDRYVRFQSSSDPRDGPPSLQILLGEGSIEWPESDWNAVALWRMVDRGDDDALDQTVNLDSFGNATAAAVAARNQLEEVHAGFLNDSLEAFRRVRAGQNRVRAPYLVHRRQPDGSYLSTADEESARLKERFSRD